MVYCPILLANWNHLANQIQNSSQVNLERFFVEWVLCLITSHAQNSPQASFASNFLKLVVLSVIFAWVFFLSLLLWEFVHNKITICLSNLRLGGEILV